MTANQNNIAEDIAAIVTAYAEKHGATLEDVHGALDDAKAEAAYIIARLTIEAAA